MYLVTAREMREMDTETIESFGLPGRVLMENAARKALDMLFDLFPDLLSKKICILAGKGNNGGDALVIARYLMQMGGEITTFVTAPRERIKGDALVNLVLLETICEKQPRPVLHHLPDEAALQGFSSRIRHHDIFVDGLLGTGLTGPVRGMLCDLITTLNATKKPIFSLDIASGLDADRGMAWGPCIKACATATFGFAKAGHFLGNGREFTGQLGVMDIGIPPHIAVEKSPRLHLTRPEDVTALFPPRNTQAHKGSFGHLLILAGSRGKTGAAVLAARAAMAAGTGLVTLGIPDRVNDIVESCTLEAMTLPLPDDGKGRLTLAARDTVTTHVRGKSALALGPGLGVHDDTRTLVRQIIRETALPLILDADALNCIADDPSILKHRTAPTILTPHPGEMARLTGQSTRDIQADRLTAARSFAEEYGVILVLKGAGTLTALADGTTFFCPTGNPGMASGGTGDLLTGIIAGFTAQGMPPGRAARAGVFLHGACGDRAAEGNGAVGFTAADLITTLPATLSSLMEPQPPPSPGGFGYQILP